MAIVRSIEKAALTASRICDGDDWRFRGIAAVPPQSRASTSEAGDFGSDDGMARASL